MVLGNRTWSLFFITPKYFNYKQYNMMLLEQCDRIVVKVLASNTWLYADRTYFCLVTWLDYSFAFA